MKIIVVGVNNCWGRAETLTQALKNANKPKHYAAFLCSDETKVNDIDGGLEYPLSHGEPILLDRILPKTAKPKPTENATPGAPYDDSIVITMVEKVEAAVEKWQKVPATDNNGAKSDGVLMEAVSEALGNARLELSRMQRQSDARRQA
jgi:hypothetical protein